AAPAALPGPPREPAPPRRSPLPPHLRRRVREDDREDARLPSRPRRLDPRGRLWPRALPSRAVGPRAGAAGRGRAVDARRARAAQVAPAGGAAGGGDRGPGTRHDGDRPQRTLSRLPGTLNPPWAPCLPPGGEGGTIC